MIRKFKKSELKKEIVAKFGSVAKLKKHLKNIATYQYGCYYAETNIYGCKISYTSNPNCFASYIINIPMVGMSSQLALGKSSITPAGKKRGCFSEKFFISI